MNLTYSDKHQSVKLGVLFLAISSISDLGSSQLPRTLGLVYDLRRDQFVALSAIWSVDLSFCQLGGIFVKRALKVAVSGVEYWRCRLLV